jgi:hypothetical protein
VPAERPALAWFVLGFLSSAALSKPIDQLDYRSRATTIGRQLKVPHKIFRVH